MSLLPAWEKLQPLRRCYVRLLDPDGDVFDVWQNHLEAELSGLNEHHRVFRSNREWQEFLDSQRAIATDWDLRHTVTDFDRHLLATLKILWEPLSMRGRRYRVYGKHLTTEQLMEAAIPTVKQMSPSEKSKLRQQIKQSFLKPVKWMHDDFLFEEHMREKEMLELAKRIAKHEAPGMHRTVEKKLLAKTADRLLRVSTDVLRDMKCDPRVN
jgi:hypothetical protein